MRYLRFPLFSAGVRHRLPVAYRTHGRSAAASHAAPRVGDLLSPAGNLLAQPTPVIVHTRAEAAHEKRNGSRFARPGPRDSQDSRSCRTLIPSRATDDELVLELQEVEDIARRIRIHVARTRITDDEEVLEGQEVEDIAQRIRIEVARARARRCARTIRAVQRRERERHARAVVERQILPGQG